MTAAQYIYQNGLLYKFGTGANSIGTEARLKQQEFIQKQFGLTAQGFSDAFREAERLDALDGEAEAEFDRAHPELNP